MSDIPDLNETEPRTFQVSFDQRQDKDNITAEPVEILE
jgi:hypothetical protein